MKKFITNSVIIFVNFFLSYILCYSQGGSKNEISYNIDLKSVYAIGKLYLNGNEVMNFGDKENPGNSIYTNIPINLYVKSGENQITVEIDSMPNNNNGLNFTIYIFQYKSTKPKQLLELIISSEVKLPLKQTFTFTVDKPPYTGFADVEKLSSMREYALWISCSNVIGSVTLNNINIDSVSQSGMYNIIQIDKLAKRGKNSLFLRLLPLDTKDTEPEKSWKKIDLKIYEFLPGLNATNGNVVYKYFYHDTLNPKIIFPTSLDIDLDMSKASGSSVWEQAENINLTQQDQDTIRKIIRVIYQAFSKKDFKKTLELSKFIIQEEAKATAQSIAAVTKTLEKQFKFIMKIMPKNEIKPENFEIKEMNIVGDGKFLSVKSGKNLNQMLFAKINGNWVIVK